MAQTNIKSTALEQPVSIARDGFGQRVSQMISRYKVYSAYVFYLSYFFSMTDSFASMLTLHAIF